MAVLFTVGQRYLNRDGEFEVLAIQGNSMKIRYRDGRELDADVTLQARIQERMREEDGTGSEDTDHKTAKEDGRAGDGHKTEEIRDFVAEILQGIRQPWPSDITDRVCLNIENRRDRLSHYEKLVQDFGKPTVNVSIGVYVKQLTGMENTGRTATPKSGLISSYSILEPGKSKPKPKPKAKSK